MSAIEEAANAKLVVRRDKGYYFPMAGAHRCSKLDAITSPEMLDELLSGAWRPEMEGLRDRQIHQEGPNAPPGGTFQECLRLRAAELKKQLDRLASGDKLSIKPLTATCLHYAVSDSLASSLFEYDVAPASHPQKQGGLLITSGSGTTRSEQLFNTIRNPDRYYKLALLLVSPKDAPKPDNPFPETNSFLGNGDLDRCLESFHQCWMETHMKSESYLAKLKFAFLARAVRVWLLVSTPSHQTRPTVLSGLFFCRRRKTKKIA